MMGWLRVAAARCYCFPCGRRCRSDYHMQLRQLRSYSSLALPPPSRVVEQCYFSWFASRSSAFTHGVRCSSSSSMNLYVYSPGTRRSVVVNVEHQVICMPRYQYILRESPRFGVIFNLFVSCFGLYSDLAHSCAIHPLMIPRRQTKP